MIALSPEQAAWLKTLATGLYLPHGYFLTPVRMELTPEGKKDPRPLEPYTGWRDRPQKAADIEAMFRALSAFNALLARSEDMLVVDTDDLKRTGAFAEGIAAGALPTTNWISETGRGYHMYYTNPDGLTSRSGPGIDIQTTISHVGVTNGKGVLTIGSWHPVRKRCYELVDIGSTVSPGVFRAEHMAMLEQLGLIQREPPPRPPTPRITGIGDPVRYRGLLALQPPDDEPTFFRIAASLLTVFPSEEVIGWAALGAKHHPTQDRRKIEGWARNASKGAITIGTAIHYYQNSGAYSQRVADAEYHMRRIGVMSEESKPTIICDTTIHGFVDACDQLGWKIRHNISCREIEIFFNGAWRVLSEKHLMSQIVDTLALRCYLQNKDGTTRIAKFVRRNVEQHLETLSEKHRYNELQEWLNTLSEWDGEDRISGLFADMFGADDSELNRWAANAVFWQVIDRIVECQHGKNGVSHRATVLFAGGQTVGKTAFVRELLPSHLRARYLVEGLNFGMDRDSLLRICSGKLLVEVGEFGVGRNLEDTKAFITAASDQVNHKFQRPYHTARSFVMVGGFNPENATPLARDLSGNSRFVVIEFEKRCEDVPGRMEAIRDQLWAQAWNQYQASDEHYRWVPDRLAEEQAATNRKHEYENAALVEAIVDHVRENPDDFPVGARFKFGTIYEKVFGPADVPRVTHDRKMQHEFKTAAVQSGYFGYDRKRPEGQRKALCGD